MSCLLTYLLPIPKILCWVTQPTLSNMRTERQLHVSRSTFDDDLMMSWCLLDGLVHDLMMSWCLVGGCYTLSIQRDDMTLHTTGELMLLSVGHLKARFQGEGVVPLPIY